MKTNKQSEETGNGSHSDHNGEMNTCHKRDITLKTIERKKHLMKIQEK